MPYVKPSEDGLFEEDRDMIKDENVAQILFKPVCSKCGKVIEQRIDFLINIYPIDVIEVISNRAMLTQKTYEIVPDKCPHCGTHFDMIALCGKLPFDGYERMNKK